MKKNCLKTYIWLFAVNFSISAFTFGGGYVVIPMIRKYFVKDKHKFNEEELLEMAAVAQSSPGAIAVNLSVLAGYKTAGLIGAVISGFSAVCPPIIILSVISSWYDYFYGNLAIAAVLKGMEAGVAALIVDMVLDMIKTIICERQLFITALVPTAFVASFIFNVPVVLILLLSTLLCLGESFYRNKIGKKRDV